MVRGFGIGRVVGQMGRPSAATIWGTGTTMTGGASVRVPTATSATSVGGTTNILLAVPLRLPTAIFRSQVANYSLRMIGRWKMSC